VFVDSVVNTSGAIQQLISLQTLLIININSVLSRSMLFNLLCAMIFGEEKSFPLRISILYFLEYYLHKNKTGKSIILQTLLSQTKNGQFFVLKRQKNRLFEFHLAANKHTMSDLLRSGYLSEDIVASWCFGILFSHLSVKSQQSKEALFKTN